MPTENPRAKARNSIQRRIEDAEDIVLGVVVRQRANTFKRSQAICHQQVWRDRTSDRRGSKRRKG